MAKLYIPKVTVTLRREFDGRVEREETISVIGRTAEYLEGAVGSAMGLAMFAREPQQSSED